MILINVVSYLQSNRFIATNSPLDGSRHQRKDDYNEKQAKQSTQYAKCGTCCAAVRNPVCKMKSEAVVKKYV